MILIRKKKYLPKTKIIKVKPVFNLINPLIRITKIIHNCKNKNNNKLLKNLLKLLLLLKMLTTINKIMSMIKR